MLQPGDQIPDFKLITIEREEFTQDDLAGKRALLAFYPFAFSGVCTHQLADYQEHIDQFKDRGIEIFAISIDHVHAQKAFQERLGAWDITFLADFHPKGVVAEAFGVYNADVGFNDRSVVLVGPDGIVQWSKKMEKVSDAPSTADIIGEVDLVNVAGG